MSSTECPAEVLTESNTGEDETMAENAAEAPVDEHNPIMEEDKVQNCEAEDDNFLDSLIDEM